LGDRRFYVEDRLQKIGIAAALARVIISMLYLTDQPADLIAHVHEFNNAPRRLLPNLGFLDTGEQSELPGEPPANMQRNSEGKVVGDVYRFQRSALADFASWFETFAGELHGRDGRETPLTINVDIWKHRDVLIPALRGLAA
jgi:hypothetical protein